MARLRLLVIGLGVAWSIVFVVAGPWYRLQLYADGALFSYAVAAQDAWTFHWHNISGRVFVYLVTLLPAEMYVGLTSDAHGGIAVYGGLFYIAPLLGIAATLAADRSPGRVVFAYACASTACLCPLVFGFPTEMWLAQAMFWPALASCHYARPGIGGLVTILAALLALVFTHEAAVVLAAAIALSALLRGTQDGAFRRAGSAFAVALAAWLAVKSALPPDAYFASIFGSAARYFIDLSNFGSPIVVLLLATLGGYGAAFFVLRQLSPERAHIFAALLIVIVLAVYWLRFDSVLHAEDRYAVRTVLFLGILIFGALAVAYALRAEGRLAVPVRFVPRLMSALTTDAVARMMSGAFLLAMLVHAVETTKFVRAWIDYKSAVRALAMGVASDPALGDPHFVSSARIDNRLNRLAWSSTTPFLSVLLAPNLTPSRLVLDPGDNYVWLSCPMARANEQAKRAIPAESRRLVRLHACLHRP
jgi:hypothetical protein